MNKTLSIVKVPAAALVALSIALIGCGSGGGSDAATATTEAKPKPTTTETEATTTTELVRAEKNTATLATAGVYGTDDVPDGWTVGTEAIDYSKGTKADECSNPVDGPFYQLPSGAIAGGPSFAVADGAIHLGSTAAVFNDEADAKEWTSFVQTDEFVECQRAAFEESANDSGEVEYIIKVATTEEATAGLGTAGFERTTGYEYVVDGEVTAQVYVNSYRVGRAVLTVQLDVGPVALEELDAVVAAESELRGVVFERLARLQGVEEPG